MPRSESAADLVNRFKHLFSSDDQRAMAMEQLTKFMTSPAVHGQNESGEQKEGFFPGNPYSTAFGLYLMRMAISPQKKEKNYEALIKDLDDFSESIYNNNPRKTDLDKLFIDKNNEFKVGQKYYPTQTYMEEITAPYLKAISEIRSQPHTDSAPTPSES